MPSERINVESAEQIDFDSVEVKARGPGRSPRIFTVHFDRRGAIKNGFLHVPAHMQAYIAPADLPPTVRTAAEELFKSKR